MTTIRTSNKDRFEDQYSKLSPKEYWKKEYSYARFTRKECREDPKVLGWGEWGYEWVQDNTLMADMVWGAMMHNWYERMNGEYK